MSILQGDWLQHKAGKARDWTSVRWARAQTRFQEWNAWHRSMLDAQSRKSPSAGFWISTIAGGTVVALALAAAVIPGNAFRGPLADYLSLRFGRDVHIAGDLHMRLFSTQPSIAADGVTIANADWAGGGDMAKVRHLHIEARLWPLLRGKLILPAVEISQPDVLLVREKSGRSNWQMGVSNGEPFSLPPIRRFVVDKGQLHIIDAKRRLTFEGTINSRENAKDGDNAFQLLGQGHLNSTPFEAEIHGGPLLNVDETKPYEFHGNVRAGGTRIVARGAITHPFDFGVLHAAVTFSGPDMADLYYLIGVTLPNTPPYRLSGQLVRNGERYRFDGMTGHVGDSDLNGTLLVDASAPRTFLSGDLHSRVLDFDDLGPLFGAPPSIGRNETASASQTRQAQAVAVKETGPAPRVLPDATLQIERVRQMDADVSYKADTVKSRDFPLRSLNLKVKLDHGVLSLDPVALAFARGTISGHATVDARHDVPASDVDLRFTGLTLEQFFSGKDKPLEGTLEARVKAHALGNSIHKAASTATGTVTAVIPHGEMRKALAELLGVNLTKGLIPLLFGDKSQTEIRCGIAHFEASNGVLMAKSFIFDTDVVRARGKGTVNLKTEQVDLQLQGEPKSFELLRLRAPVTIKGSLSKLDVGIDASKSIVQGGLAAAAGIFLTPAAALLPFVNPGLAKDANCTALIGEARSEGVRVKARQG